MYSLLIPFSFLCLAKITLIDASLCGCKSVQPCYLNMVNSLKDRDEVACVEDAAIGVSTLMVYFKALTQFCPEFITVNTDSITFEARILYEIVVSHSKTENEEENKPVIVIDAGQEAGTESVGLALYIIQQLVACEEYLDMIRKIRWVIMPSVNPDGMEFARFNRLDWRKNVRPVEGNLSYGVDISRNFDNQWGSCERVNSVFSPIYPGPGPASEQETAFVKNVLNKYKKDIKAYLSIRRDGHAIMFPYAYTKNMPASHAQISKIAADIATKVNQRAGGVQLFANDSIYNINGKERCGHSVDYAYETGITLSYEMRVFVGSDNRLITKFQALPRGYEASLRNGYFIGIRELYNAITSGKYGRAFL